MTFLLLITALVLSSIAAWYSIAGLMAIFSALPIPIMIMGGALEVSKLVVASWLYRRWKVVPFLMKTYFTVALVVLMGLTSMGIFGFLSKAHLDQAVPASDIQAQVEFIDEKIKIEQENINADRKELSQLDSQIDRYTELGAVTKGANLRRDQQADRERIINSIETSQAKIAKLREERQPIASQVRQLEAEVGPIKYIADLIYGEQAKEEGFLEKAVRIVILLIVFVFDPLAVLMVIAANKEMVERMEPPNVLSQSIPPVSTDSGVEETIKEKEDEFWRLSELSTETESGQTPNPSEEESNSTPTSKEIKIEDNVEVSETLNKEETAHDRKVGRLLSEINREKPNKTKSFLKKVDGMVPNSENVGDEDPFK